MKKRSPRSARKPRPTVIPAADRLAKALADHHAGRVAEAEAGYRMVLGAEPGNVDANNNLAILLRNTHRGAEALACYGRAIAARPDDARIVNNMACLLSDLSRGAEAGKAARIALCLDPAYAEAWGNLGNLLRAEGNPIAADRANGRAVRLKPEIARFFIAADNGDRPAPAPFAEAFAHHQAGRLDAAEAGYRAILAGDPHHPFANNNLAILLRATRRPEEALDLYRRALGNRPEDSSIHNNAACLLAHLARPSEAAVAAHAALALSPDYAEAWFNLASIEQSRGDAAAAETAMRRAIRLRPELTAGRTAVEATPPLPDLFADAIARQKAGQLDAAEAGYRAILRAEPDHPHANSNLAVLLRGQRRYDEALECYRRSLNGVPDNAALMSNLACLLSDMARETDAATAARIATILKPDFPDAWFNLGNILHQSGRLADAKAAYGRAIRINPASAQAYCNLGSVHKDCHEVGAAIECLKTSLRLAPDLAAPLTNLGEALKEQGQVIEAIALFQKGMEIHPDLALVHSNLLFALHYTPLVPPEIIARAHRYWNDCHARPLLPATRHFANDRSPVRRLRVGYVSPDFCTHSCAYFSEPLLRAHDPAAVEIVCYATSTRTDATTKRFMALASQWRSLARLDDAEAAALIESDRIDILVDLAGHTGGGRPLTFARKPAPIQVTWLGYPDTSGITAMDYRLTDDIADPVGTTERWHSETLIRLRQGFLAFQPTESVEMEEIPPAIAKGFVTFGSFNNLAKVTPEVVRVWSDILKQLPTARLVLKSQAFCDGPALDAYQALFASNGIAPDRVDLLPFVRSVEHHLRVYDRIDIALDPFPYNGTTTTCEALWMGVPVITRCGQNHVARVGASLLTRCGLPELIAQDDSGYVAAAVELARDLPRLSELRRTMRTRLHCSTLTDYGGFARTVENAFRAMWQTWLRQTA